MAYRIFSISRLNYETKMQEKNKIKMDIHHHKPSRVLAMARQFRCHRIHMDYKESRRKIEIKNKECNFRFNKVKIKEKKITYTGVTLSASFTLILP